MYVIKLVLILRPICVERASQARTLVWKFVLNRLTSVSAILNEYNYIYELRQIWKGFITN